VDVAQGALVRLEALVDVHVVRVVTLVVKYLLAVVALEEVVAPFSKNT
jgi:hypothetical protein